METVHAHKNSVAGDLYYELIDDEGNKLDFGSQFVRIEVAEVGHILSSDPVDGYAPVRMDGTKLYIDWGQFDLPEGPYTPTVYGYRTSDGKGEVITGKGSRGTFNLILLPDDRELPTDL